MNDPMGVGGYIEPAESFPNRLLRIQADIELGMKCTLHVGTDAERYFLQIWCERVDTITKEVGLGKGGKAYLSPFMTDSEIIQIAFGLYKSYWEHEARETFIWRERRPFGPHISTEALWEVARRVDVRSAKHVEDQRRVGPDGYLEVRGHSGALLGYQGSARD